MKCRVRKRINQIKMPNDDKVVEISHKHDLIKLGILIPDLISFTYVFEYFPIVHFLLVLPCMFVYCHGDQSCTTI